MKVVHTRMVAHLIAQDSVGVQKISQDGDGTFESFQ